MWEVGAESQLLTTKDVERGVIILPLLTRSLTFSSFMWSFIQIFFLYFHFIKLSSRYTISLLSITEISCCEKNYLILPSQAFLS